MHRIPAITLAIIVSLTVPVEGATQEVIATIDTYGLGKVSRESVLEAAGIREGDAVPDADEIGRIVRKLKAIPGVEQAAISVINVPRQNLPAGSPAQPTVYIGIREVGRPGVTFRDAPQSDVGLPNEIVDTYREFELAMVESFRRGNFDEDDSNGYALSGDEALRAVEKRFVPLAQRHYDRLVEVLRTAKSAKQREMAAWVLGYAADKTKAATELDAAARDPGPRVRNNAMRALGVILSYAEKHPELSIEAPIDSYLDLVESLEWTDRNKAMLVLLGLCASGNEAILARLRTRSLPALVEMARWQTEGHAMMAFLLVGRIAGMNEPEIIEAWSAGKREDVIARALESAAAKGSTAK